MNTNRYTCNISTGSHTSKPSMLYGRPSLHIVNADKKSQMEKKQIF